MTIDVGLAAGICTLWQQEALFDYTIHVGDYKIPVHKAIMASVSEYFRVMLNGSMLESTTNRVELKGLNVEVVSKLIQLIYTGDENIVNNSAMEIFGTAVYFQMTFVIQACVDCLIGSLSDKNCLVVLALFVKYSCDEGVERVKTFLKSNYKSVVEFCKHEETPYEAVQVVPECWGKSEWDLLLYLKHWVDVNYEDRKVHVNDLMSQVRFSLIDQGQLAAIMEMDIFTSSEEPWCELVRKSVTYHKKPIHHKILDTSIQAKTRGPPGLVVFSEAKSFHAIAKRGNWVKHETVNSPEIHRIEACIKVNNFLIICSVDGRQQQWKVFDPRTMKWSQMVTKASNTGFASFYHAGKLYALGGGQGFSGKINSLSRSVEEYSFHTNTWQEVNKMPAPMKYHAVCVYEDSVYVSGGWRGHLDGPARDVDCLDMKTGTWEKKAPMPKALMSHEMHVMTINREKVIVIIDDETDSDTRYDCEISYYQPATDQWSEYEPRFSPKVPYDIKWVSKLRLVHGNTVLFINIEQGNEDDDGWAENIHPDNIPYDEACVQWRFSQARENISEVNYPKYPSRCSRIFGAVLSI